MRWEIPTSHSFSRWGDLAADSVPSFFGLEPPPLYFSVSPAPQEYCFFRLPQVFRSWSSLGSMDFISKSQTFDNLSWERVAAGVGLAVISVSTTSRSVNLVYILRREMCRL